MSENHPCLPKFPLDINRRELASHGSPEFPCAHYVDYYYNNAYPWHWHDEFELAYVEQGSLRISVNERRYTLQKGSGIFLNTGVLHSYSGISDTACHFPNILFHPSLIGQSRTTVYWKTYLQPLIESAALSHIVLCPDIPWQKEVLEFIRSTLRALTFKDFGYEFTVRNHLSDIILMICRHCPIQPRQTETDVPDSTQIIRTRQMLDYIGAHFTEHVSLEEIAAAACISRRECQRCFQQIIGMSPKQYVTSLRLQKAKTLLADTSLSLPEIKEACGFEDQSYFTKLFRLETGLPPGQWRKKHSNI